MSIVDPVVERRGSFQPEDLRISGWQFFNDSTLECRVLLCPEPGGGFSVHAIRLPGVVSQGATIPEAIDAIREAFRGAIEEYRIQGMEIPWSNEPVVERVKGSVERWILVDV